MPIIDLNKVNEKNVSQQSISKDRVPNTILDLDTQNETVLKNTGKGTAATYVGYNTNKPNLNSPWAGQFVLGVGSENDNVSFEPSVLLNPNSSQHITVVFVAIALLVVSAPQQAVAAPICFTTP